MKTISALTAITLLLASGTAIANEEWPNKPITIVMPSAAGGTGDIMIRALAKRLSEKLKQPVVIDNRAGASGVLGVSVAMNAPADGYTFLVGYPTNLIASQFQQKSLPFSPKDVMPVTSLAINEMVLVTNSAIPGNNAKAVVDWAKQQTKPVAYASYGEGSYAHLISNYLTKEQHVNAIHVPYKSEAPMLVAVAANEASWGIAVATAAKKMADTGKVKVVGAFLPARSKLNPEIPTVNESGLTDPLFALSGWYGLFAKAGTPKKVLDRMEHVIVEIGKEPAAAENFAQMGLFMHAAGKKELERLYQRDTAAFKVLYDKSGIQ